MREHMRRLQRLEANDPTRLDTECEASADRVLEAVAAMAVADGIDIPADRGVILAGIRRTKGLDQ
jgi:hypothetical protein